MLMALHVPMLWAKTSADGFYDLALTFDTRPLNMLLRLREKGKTYLEYNVQVSDGVWYVYTFYTYYHFLFKGFLSGRKPPGNLKAANRL